MPGIRALAVAAAVGLIVGGYLDLWIHWPTFVAVAIGATMAIVILLISASFGEDPAAADAAWREAAPDLAARSMGPPPSGDDAAPGESPEDGSDRGGGSGT